MPFFLLFLAFAAYGQQQGRVAIINTVDNHDSIGFSDLTYLTDNLRETAVNVLFKSRYGVMTTESIVAFLGSEERAAKECREATCLADLGRKVNADYVAQGRIGRFDGNLTIKVELYSSKNGNLIGSFTGSSKSISGLLDIMNENAPALLKKIDLEDIQAKEARLDKERKALETEKREHTERQAMIGYQYLSKMPVGVRWSYGWFYNTLSCRFADFGEWSESYGSETFYLSNPDKIFDGLLYQYRHSGGYTDDAFEWIVGYIWQPFYWLGIFGGGGFRHTNEYRRYDIYRNGYSNGWVYEDTEWVSANELRHDFTYELGLEFDFKMLAAYISIRNFSNAGGGIGFIF